ncbi:MAG: ribonuclease P protein component, partial [Deltaproteobacteria bacterium]|nr:ribonuclease P protein component [Deltaproteobacteria bacterium]
MLSDISEFRHLMNRGERVVFNSLIAFYQTGRGRLGIVVSKKVSRKATDRNRV